MAKTTATRSTPQPDAVRIVPMHGISTQRAAAAAAPKLTYRKGPLISAVQVFTIFWGDGWKSKPQSDLIPQVNAFFDFVLTSALIDQLAEYNAGGVKIAHVRRTGTVNI